MERSVGLQTDAANGRIEFFEATRGSYESAAGAQSRDEVGDAATSLFPNFVCRAAIVRLPVRRIAVLIGIKISFGIVGDHFLDAMNGAIGAFVARSNHQFGAKRAENFLALMGRAVRQAQGDAVGERGADHGVGDAGIAAGGVDDALTRSQRSASKAGLDHAESWAVFDRTARVEPFRLGGKLDIGEVAADALQPKQGRVANAVEDGAANLAWGRLRSGMRELFCDGHGRVGRSGE